MSMLTEYFWYIVAAIGLLAFVWIMIRCSDNESDSHYHGHGTYVSYGVHGAPFVTPQFVPYAGSVTKESCEAGADDSFATGYTDFQFWIRKFMTEVDNILERSQAASMRDDREEAEDLALEALAFVDKTLGRDHWYAVRVLDRLGDMRYREGMLIEAREYWEAALQVALEWPNKVHHDVQRIREDVAKCSDMLGF